MERRGCFCSHHRSLLTVGLFVFIGGFRQSNGVNEFSVADGEDDTKSI